MGRPKGSLNRVYKKAPAIKLGKPEKRKRGRPKKASIVPAPLPVSNFKKIKFLGYCPKCKFVVGDSDLVKKTIFECPGCGKKARVSKLKKDRGTEPMTRKEYLETMIHASSFHDMPAMNEHEIDPKELKIQE